MAAEHQTVAAMIGLVVLVPSARAAGAAKRKHQCTNTSRGAMIQQDYGYPNVGTTADMAGLFDESCEDGRKTHRVSQTKVTITGIGGGGVNAISASVGSQATPVIKFKAETIGYSERGTLNSNGTGTTTPQVDGSLLVAGEFKDHRRDWAVPRGDRERDDFRFPDTKRGCDHRVE